MKVSSWKIRNKHHYCRLEVKNIVILPNTRLSRNFLVNLGKFGRNYNNYTKRMKSNDETNPKAGTFIAHKLRVKGNLLMRVTCNLIEKLPSWGQSVRRRLAYWRSPACNPAYYNHGFRGQRTITEPWLTRGPGDTGRGLLGGGAYVMNIDRPPWSEVRVVETRWTVWGLLLPPNIESNPPFYSVIN